MRIPSRFAVVLAVVGVALACGGCSDDDDQGPPATFAFDPSRVVIGVGTWKFAPVVNQPDAGVDLELLGDIATLDQDWVLTGVSQGVALLVGTPRDGSPPDTCTVIVATTFFDFEGNATDATGNGHDAVVHGATLTADRHGRAGAAYSVGTDEYLAAFSGAAAGISAAYTFTAWLRWDAIAGAMNCWLGKNYNEAFAFGLDSGGSVEPDSPTDAGVYRGMKAYVGGVATNFHTGHDFTCGTGAWYHVAVTFDDAANVSELYVNGMLVQSQANNRTLGTNVRDIGIGRDITYSDHFIGVLDDVGFFARRLTAPEVALLHGS